MHRLLLITLAALLALPACGGGAAETRRTPARTQHPAPEPMDAFAEFDGQRVALGEQVKLHREPVGVTQLRAMVALARTDWVIRIRGDGEEEKTASANLVVQRGGAVENVRIEVGESGSARGVQITVFDAGEVYEESSMRWVQYALVTITEMP